MGFVLEGIKLWNTTAGILCQLFYFFLPYEPIKFAAFIIGVYFCVCSSTWVISKFLHTVRFLFKINLFYKIHLQAFNVISIVLYHSGPTC